MAFVCVDCLISSHCMRSVRMYNERLFSIRYAVHLQLHEPEVNVYVFEFMVSTLYKKIFKMTFRHVWTLCQTYSKTWTSSSRRRRQPRTCLMTTRNRAIASRRHTQTSGNTSLSNQGTFFKEFTVRFFLVLGLISPPMSLSYVFTSVHVSACSSSTVLRLW